MSQPAAMIYPAGVPEGADGADACLGLSNGVGRLAGLSFENVHFSVKGRAILNGIDGWLPASRLLAVLGPSGVVRCLHFASTSFIVVIVGAGKTSLLDVLAGCSKAGAVEGTVQAHLDTGVVSAIRLSTYATDHVILTVELAQAEIKWRSCGRIS